MIRLGFVLTMIVFLTVGCTSTAVVVAPAKKMPPGQEKKVTGSQSAKPYAPGQQKKKK